MTTNIATGTDPGRELPMLNLLKRICGRPSTTDNPLVIRDLLDHPALRALVLEADATPDAPPSLSWTGLAASGPIRFEHVVYDVAA